MGVTLRQRTTSSGGFYISRRGRGREPPWSVGHRVFNLSAVCISQEMVESRLPKGPTLRGVGAGWGSLPHRATLGDRMSYIKVLAFIGLVLILMVMGSRSVMETHRQVAEWRGTR